METIIGLLFILLPLIFKLIGSRLEKSGQPGKAGKILREFGEALDGEDSPMNDWKHLGEELFGKPESEIGPKVESVELPVETVIRQVPTSSKTPKSPMIVEEDETKKKREKIDPKKLVIYSEIMKPKYTE